MFILRIVAHTRTTQNDTLKSMNKKQNTIIKSFEHVVGHFTNLHSDVTRATGYSVVTNATVCSYFMQARYNEDFRKHVHKYIQENEQK